MRTRDTERENICKCVSVCVLEICEERSGIVECKGAVRKRKKARERERKRERVEIDGDRERGRGRERDGKNERG